MLEFKKLLLAVSILFATNAHADVITLSTVTADSTVATFQNNFNTIKTVINGNLEGSGTNGSTKNILADSLGELDFADAINPRVRDTELLNITVDTISGGAIASQGTMVESGCVQATDTDLTADVSACVAYINGYRVSKAATAQTYANTSTTYLWLSQSGTYTQSTNPNVSIANSSLLSVVTTSGGQITTVSNLFTTRIPSLVIPSNYRSWMYVSKDSATTVTVLPGTAEISNSILSKTSTTTLTITTAGDWAGGVALNAANTYGFVGVDTSGNVKMHTTAPTHDNFSLTTTAGKKRYASWSSTVYRILGWFYMGTANNVDVSGNIKEGDVANSIVSIDTNVLSLADTNFADIQVIRFYSSGGPIMLLGTTSGDAAGGSGTIATRAVRNSNTIAGAGASTNGTNGEAVGTSFNYLHINQPQSTAAYIVQGRVNANAYSVRSRVLVVSEQ